MGKARSSNEMGMSVRSRKVKVKVKVKVKWGCKKRER